MNWDKVVDALKAGLAKLWEIVKGASVEEVEEQTKLAIQAVLGPIAEQGLPKTQEDQLVAWLRGRLGPAAQPVVNISDEIVKAVGRLALEAALEQAERINAAD